MTVVDYGDKSVSSLSSTGESNVTITNSQSLISLRSEEYFNEPRLRLVVINSLRPSSKIGGTPVFKLVTRAGSLSTPIT